jgi:hypothetical protein
MEYERPEVKAAFPVGDLGLQHLPDDLNIQKTIEKEFLYFHNPFQTGLSIKKEYLSSVNYSTLSSGFIVNSPHLIEVSERSRKNQQLHRALHQVSNTFWPVAVNVFVRQLKTPKRDLDNTPDITPDMKLIISPPKRKPDSPKLNRKPKPSKPGGR